MSHTRTSILLRVESHMDLNVIIDMTCNHHYKSQICNPVFQSAYNRSNLTIWLYDVITLDCTRIFPKLHLLWITDHTKYILITRVFTSVYDHFTQALIKFPLLFIYHWDKPIVTIAHAQNLYHFFLMQASVDTSKKYADDKYRSMIVEDWLLWVQEMQKSIKRQKKYHGMKS